jgi:hypothetical protein
MCCFVWYIEIFMLAIVWLCLLETEQRIKMSAVIFSAAVDGVFIVMNVLSATMAIAQAF